MVYYTLPLLLGSRPMRSIPQTAKGHRLVMDVSSSGWAFDIDEKCWHMSHLRAYSMQFAFMVGQ